MSVGIAAGAGTTVDIPETSTFVAKVPKRLRDDRILLANHFS